MALTEHEKFWNEISQIEEVDYDDEMINRLLRFKAIQCHLSGVHTILDVGAATGAYSIPLARMQKRTRQTWTIFVLSNMMHSALMYLVTMHLTSCYVLMDQFLSLAARQEM